MSGDCRMTIGHFGEISVCREIVGIMLGSSDDVEKMSGNCLMMIRCFQGDECLSENRRSNVRVCQFVGKMSRLLYLHGKSSDLCRICPATLE